MPGKQKETWFQPWVSVQNAVLFLAGCFAVALLGLNKSELASWVQAVGSIAAILGAFWISNSQIIKEQKRRVDESIAKLDSICAVVKSAVDHSNSFLEFTGQKPNKFAFQSSWEMVFSEALASSIDSLKAIPAHELGSYELVINFMMIRSSVAKVASGPQSFRQAFADQELIFMYQNISSQSGILAHAWAGFEYACTDRKIALAFESRNT
jgi:hypothetical protein